MGLMIPLMAGLTPDDFEVTLCDERLEDLDFDAGWDLVGMTTTIGASLRAYQLGDEFRKPAFRSSLAVSTQRFRRQRRLSIAMRSYRVRPIWCGPRFCRTGVMAS